MPSTQVIRLTDIRAEAMRLFLNYLYTDELALDGDVVESVVEILYIGASGTLSGNAKNQCFVLYPPSEL